MVAIRDAISIAITADGKRAADEFRKVGDTAKRELGKADASTRNTSATFAKAGAIMGGAAIVAGVALKRAGDAASDLNESVSKSKVIFGEAAPAAEKFAEAAAKIGISKQVALEAAGSFGVLFTGIGKSATEAEKMSERMVTLAADVGSFNNVPIEEALMAIQSGLRGEAEPLRKFGVLLDDATLKAYAMRTGLIKTTTQALTPAQKAQSAYGVILEQTKKQQGDFARTSDGLANTQKKVEAAFANLTAKIGAAALPVMQKVADVALAVVGAFELLPAPLQAMIGTVAVGAVGVLALSSAFAFLGSALSTMKAQSAAAGTGIAGMSAAIKEAIVPTSALSITTLTAGDSALVLATGEAAAGTAAAVATPAVVGLGAAAGKAALGFLAATGPVALLVGIVAGAAYIMGAFGDDVDKATAATKGLGKAAAETNDSLDNLTNKAIGQAIVENEKLAEAVRDAGLSVNEVADYVRGSGPAYDSAVQKVRAYHDAHSDTGFFGGFSDKLTLLTEFLGDQEDAYAANVSEMERARTEQKRLAGVTDDMSVALDKQHKAADRLQDSLAYVVKRTKEINDAERDAISAGLDYEDALQNQKDKAEDLAAAIREHGKSSDEAKQAQRDLVRASLEVTATLDTGKQSIIDSAAALNGGAVKGDKFKKELQRVRDTMAPGSPLRVWLDDYIARLEAIPEGVNTTVTVNGKPITTDANGNVVGGSGAGSHRAGGGPVSAGRPYIVGENGPELMVPYQSGSVVPNHRLALRGLQDNGAQGGARVYQIHVYALDPATAADSVVNALKIWERTRGPIPVKVAS